MNRRKPFFMDVTLRDGNQALKKPWNITEKISVFERLVEVGVSGAEIGFAAASKSDYESIREISGIAPDTMVLSSLSRAVESEIEASINALKFASRPRVHIVFPVSRFAIEKVLKMDLITAREKAESMVRYARKLIPNKWEIQFSGEHFGDSEDNLEFAIDLFQAVIRQGVDVINLPNTVERKRPFHFISMVNHVLSHFSGDTVFSVHTHNDLGMATATTVESFFAGVTQLEVTLNGLGERAGNTNLYEVACALRNCDVEVPLNFESFKRVSMFISRITNIPVPEKAPIVGDDVFSHRSGIHQDGVLKTKQEEKNLYGAFRPESVGRVDGHIIQFTSQSGRAAIYETLKLKFPEIPKAVMDEFQIFLKNKSVFEDRILNGEEILIHYEKFLEEKNEKSTIPYMV